MLKELLVVILTDRAIIVFIFSGLWLWRIELDTFYLGHIVSLFLFN
jgi:hypothetical protein